MNANPDSSSEAAPAGGGHPAEDAARRPVAGYNPLVPDHEVSPWPLLAQARAEQPVYYMPELDMWAVTRHDLVRQIALDTDTFRNAGIYGPASPLPPEIVDPPGYMYPVIHGITQSDPPEHTRLRRLMWRHFTPKRIADREAAVREIADSLIDGFIEEGRADLVPSLANPLPSKAIAAVLGFPPELEDKFRVWADDLNELVGIPNLPHERVVGHWRSLQEMDRSIREVIEQRRKTPENDLTTDLINAVSDEGDPALTDEEIVANIFLFIIAGSDTTAILITNTVLSLLEERERWEQVRANPSLIPTVVEETLRHRGVVRGLVRVVARDTTIAGVEIPEGAKIYIMPSSANRDEAYFDHPDRFDLERERAADHLGFGAGPHFCIGSALARLEARVALEQLVARLPELDLLPQDFEYVTHPITPGLKALHVGWPLPAK